MGRRAQGTVISVGSLVGGSSTGDLRKALETGISVHCGPVGTQGGGVRSLGTLVVDGGLWKRNVSLFGRYVRGTWRGAPLLGTLKIM